MNLHLKAKMRMAKVLVDIADDLLWECQDDIQDLPIGEEKLWAAGIHDALINAHNELRGTYCFDKGFCGAVEQRFKNLFRGHVDDNIEEIGKERELV